MEGRERALYLLGMAQEDHLQPPSEGVTEHRSVFLAAAEEVAAIMDEADTVHRNAGGGSVSAPLWRCSTLSQRTANHRRRLCPLAVKQANRGAKTMEGTATMAYATPWNPIT